VDRGCHRSGARDISRPRPGRRCAGRHLVVANIEAHRRDRESSGSAIGSARRRSHSWTRRRQPVGYSLDICEVVVDEIAREVGKALTVEFRPVTPENRIELVRSGAIDLECGSTTNSADRRKVVGFSPTMFVTGTKLLVRRGSGIRTLRDLEARRSC
jgi:ABC-type amino acid transport substrate-binding protein